MRRIIILTVAVAGMACAARAMSGPVVPFAVGEKLYYRISWGPLPVGEACLEVAGIENIDGHDCYHLIAKGGTSGLGRLLFPVDSYSESWLDKKLLFSRLFKQDYREGRRTRQQETEYDYDHNEMITKNLKNGREKRLALKGPMQDIVSSLYYARTQPLALDQAQKFMVNVSDTNYAVSFQPDQRRDIDVRPVGEVPALRVEPKPTLKIVAANNGRMWFWISDDARRLPLLLNSTMSIGNAQMVLYKMELPGVPQYSALPANPATN